MDVLPDARTRNPSGKFHRGIWWVGIACVNCGCDGGYVPEATNSVAYFCEPCAERFAHETRTWLLPDDVFHAAIVAEMQERNLTPQQAAEDTTLVKLARDF